MEITPGNSSQDGAVLGLLDILITKNKNELGKPSTPPRVAWANGRWTSLGRQQLAEDGTSLMS